MSTFVNNTTAIACIKENLHFVGFEKDEKYFKLAEKRIKENQQQLKLF